MLHGIDMIGHPVTDTRMPRSLRPATTPLSGGLRLLAAALLLGAAIAAGALQRAPLVIGVLALAFSAAFVVGRLAGWQQLVARAALWRIAASLLSVLLVQAALVAILYLMGAGFVAVSGTGWSAQPLAPVDLWVPVALGVACAALGLAAVRIEHGRNGTRAQPVSPSVPGPGHAKQPDADVPPADAELRILGAPTPDTFYGGIHFTHAARSADGAYDGSPNEASAGSDLRIHATETRLGVALPEGLRALYRVQNGGSVASLCIPEMPGTFVRYDEVLMPFSGYGDLYPTEGITTAHESFLAFADPEDDVYAPLFRNGTDRMLVLAQWYRHTLFLDYNVPGEPGVGFVDFDEADWADRIRRWPGFDAFFAQLRHFEDL